MVAGGKRGRELQVLGLEAREEIRAGEIAEPAGGAPRGGGRR